jgi:hypothetical protein
MRKDRSNPEIYIMKDGYNVGSYVSSLEGTTKCIIVEERLKDFIIQDILEDGTYGERKSINGNKLYFMKWNKP